jgi:hypothetical protein
MPLPREDTTPPVTNTKRVIIPARVTRRVWSMPQNGQIDDGQAR